MSERREREDDADELQLQQAFDELSGRTPPPDRTENILARVAAGDAVAEPVAMRGWEPTRVLVAALVLLGLAVTIVASVWQSEEEGGAGREADQQAKGITTEGEDPLRTVPKPENGLPKGTDPADLRVLRSSEAMLAAEKKLAALIAAGKVGGVDRILRFEQLGDWDYDDGLQGMPAEVRAFDGEKVLLLGFMLPLDEVEGMREFLLVESLWSCCYGTPPNIHGIVRCRMPKDKVIDYQFEPVKLVGTFRVEATIDDGYCVDIYQLDVEFLEVLQ